jgi:hypothetical protein
VAVTARVQSEMREGAIGEWRGRRAAMATMARVHS